MKRLACLALALAAACGGDDDPASHDARAIDAPDVAIDAAVDAPPALTHGGTLTALEVAVLNRPVVGSPPSFFGQGLQVGIVFQELASSVAPLMEEQPGSPLGCKLFEYTRLQAIRATRGDDEGPVTVTVGTRTLPACTYSDGVGYTCPHPATASTGGTIAAGPGPGLATLHDPDLTFGDEVLDGRYLVISGAAIDDNDGAFPIVGRSGANTIVYANPEWETETLPAAATHVHLAGVGPTPNLMDPGFVADDAAASLALAPGGGNHFAAFTAAASNIGDDFTMPEAELAKLTAVPVDGSAFTVTCDGGSCGAAAGVVLLLVTTDTSTAGMSPFAMPLPTNKRVMIRCAAIGQTSVTVPAAYMAAIMTSGYRRIQATFMRPAPMSGGPQTVNALSGHAIVGFTNRPAS